MTTGTTRLTDHDRGDIARAREVAARSSASIREHVSDLEASMALAEAFGEARHLLGVLADLAERLGGDGA